MPKQITNETCLKWSKKYLEKYHQLINIWIENLSNIKYTHACMWATLV